jgi:transcriptional regulator with XRE-family HTH domain
MRKMTARTLAMQQHQAREFVCAALVKLGTNPTELARRIEASPSTLNRFLNQDVAHTLAIETIYAVSRMAEMAVPAALLAAYGLAPETPSALVSLRRSVLQKFFDARPRQLTAICNRAGVSAETVRAFLKGRNESLVFSTYDRIAHSEGVSVFDLIGSAEVSESLGRVVVDTRIQAGLFVESNALRPEECGVALAPVRSPYLNIPLKGFLAADDSMDLHYPPGALLIAAPREHLGGDWLPRSGQHVVVRRRNEWGESELTGKEILFGPRAAQPEYIDLVPRSRNPIFQKAWRLPLRDEAMMDEDRTQIIGLIVHFTADAPAI